MLHRVRYTSVSHPTLGDLHLRYVLFRAADERIQEYMMSKPLNGSLKDWDTCPSTNGTPWRPNSTKDSSKISKTERYSSEMVSIRLIFLSIVPMRLSYRWCRIWDRRTDSGHFGPAVQGHHYRRENPASFSLFLSAVAWICQIVNHFTMIYYGLKC